MTPTWRKPAGMLIILSLIAIWCVGIVSLSVAGIVWILPLKPLLLWMETGRWR